MEVGQVVGDHQMMVEVEVQVVVDLVVGDLHMKAEHIPLRVEDLEVVDHQMTVVDLVEEGLHMMVVMGCDMMAVLAVVGLVEEDLVEVQVVVDHHKNLGVLVEEVQVVVDLE